MDFIEFSDNSKAEITLFKDLKECAAITSDYLKNGNVALSGGSTFGSLFKYWAELDLDLKNSEFFPVDERIVPFVDKDSNWGFAYKNFLSLCKHETDKDNFASSLENYKSIINKKIKNKEFPVFDTIMLGVGDDGHTASLFPGGEYLNDTTSVVLQTKSPKAPTNRISLSPKTIISAKKVITVISGNGKKEIYKRILEKDKSLPIVSILSRIENSIIYLDKNLIN